MTYNQYSLSAEFFHEILINLFTALLIKSIYQIISLNNINFFSDIILHNFLSSFSSLYCS